MKQNNDHKLKKFLCDIGEEEIYIADGLSDAFIGLSCVNGTNVAVYSTGIIAIQLMDEGMSYDEAEEHIHFNIMGANIGERTPIYIDLIPEEFWKND
jgi:hypothetical protein